MTQHIPAYLPPPRVALIEGPECLLDRKCEPYSFAGVAYASVEAWWLV